MTVDDLCMGCMDDRGGAAICPACGWREGTPTANPVHLPPRTLLRDHYLLGRVLGHGGFGIAYLAWDTDLQMKVAVKEYLPGDHATRGVDGSSVRPYGGDSQEHFEYGLTKFLEEGRAVVRFNEHPGIVSVLGFFRANGTGYLVMPYVPGMSLKQYLALKGGRLPYAEALGIAMPVMDTLRVVHEAGLLHRDISPDNIYLSDSKRVKLLDFGAARHALGDRSKSLSVILKAGYAPFEQYQTRGRQGPWTDVYALAATLYRTLTGEPPPEATARIVDDDLEPPRAKGVDMPAAAERALLKALAVNQHDRFQRVEELQQALLAITPDPLPPVEAIDTARGVLHERTVHGGMPPASDDDRGERGRAGEHGGRREHDRDSGSRDFTGQPHRDADRRATARAAATASATARAASASVAAAAAAAQTDSVPITDVTRRLSRAALDRLDPPARAIADLLARTTGLRVAPDLDAAAPRLGLVIALLTGLFGLWVCVPLAWRFLAIGWMTGTPVMAIAAPRAIAGAACAAIMALAAGGALAGDRRGAVIVWACGWLSIALGIGGMALQLLTYLPHTALAYLPASFASELTLVATAFAPAPIAAVLVLLWVRRGA